jgi:hypothetical protein
MRTVVIRASPNRELNKGMLTCSMHSLLRAVSPSSDDQPPVQVQLGIAIHTSPVRISCFSSCCGWLFAEVSASDWMLHVLQCWMAVQLQPQPTALEVILQSSFQMWWMSLQLFKECLWSATVARQDMFAAILDLELALNGVGSTKVFAAWGSLFSANCVLLLICCERKILFT